jgi:hypothetical protein
VLGAGGPPDISLKDLSWWRFSLTGLVEELVTFIWDVVMLTATKRRIAATAARRASRAVVSEPRKRCDREDRVARRLLTSAPGAGVEAASSPDSGNRIGRSLLPAYPRFRAADYRVPW